MRHSSSGWSWGLSLALRSTVAHEPSCHAQTQRGDLYVTYTVSFPASLSASQKEGFIALFPAETPYHEEL